MQWMTSQPLDFAPQLGLHDISQSGFSPLASSCFYLFSCFLFFSLIFLSPLCLWVQPCPILWKWVVVSGGNCWQSWGSTTLRAGGQLGQPAGVAGSLPAGSACLVLLSACASSYRRITWDLLTDRGEGFPSANRVLSLSTVSGIESRCGF